MEVTEQQRRRLAVLRCYHAYVEALRTAHLEPSTDVRERRRRLARAIELACLEDPELLDDFKRVFAARPPA